MLSNIDLAGDGAKTKEKAPQKESKQKPAKTVAKQESDEDKSDGE